ncbi:MAG: two component transcriptional regulator, AraC family [Eubacterium sp.]|nr:two component transcriptional regulator, AraC family [Eubacterium sp.]
MFNALIIDDDRAIRYELKKSPVFNKNGFLIAGEAGDGKEALEKVLLSDFDIALVDVRMPRTSGIQFIQELRNCGNDLCVVIISGSGDYAFTRQAIRLGAFDYLLKPINENELDELLYNARLFLEQKGQSRLLVENTNRQLFESLKLPYSVQDEQELFRLLKRNSSTAVNFAENIALRLNDFYEGDTFKISIILDNSLENLCRMLLSEMPWLKNLQLSCSKLALKQSENINLVIDSFLNNIKELSDFINNLHINGTNPVVKLLCEYFIINVEGKTTLEEAAKALNYSSKYLGKIFKEVTGESIVDYITKVKMERAKTLVLSGKYKTYEISDIIGYKNTDYFTRLFKEYHGLTPLEFKKLSR